MQQGDASNQTPPDLPSFLFKERIVYLVRSQKHCNMQPSAKAYAEAYDCVTAAVIACMLALQGMSLVPAVTELILAELLYLQYDNPTKPINMYINSAGVTVGFHS